MALVGQYNLSFIHLDLSVNFLFQVGNVIIELSMMPMNICKVVLDVFLSEEEILFSRFAGWAERFIEGGFYNSHASLP